MAQLNGEPAAKRVRGATALGGVSAGSGAEEPAAGSGCDGTAADSPDIDQLFQAALRTADPAAQVILRQLHARGVLPAQVQETHKRTREEGRCLC